MEEPGSPYWHFFPVVKGIWAFKPAPARLFQSNVHRQSRRPAHACTTQTRLGGSMRLDDGLLALRLRALQAIRAARIGIVFQTDLSIIAAHRMSPAGGLLPVCRGAAGGSPDCSDWPQAADACSEYLSTPATGQAAGMMQPQQARRATQLRSPGRPRLSG